MARKFSDKEIRKECRVMVNHKCKQQAWYIGQHGILVGYDIGAPYPCRVRFDYNNIGVFWPRELDKVVPDVET